MTIPLSELRSLTSGDMLSRKQALKKLSGLILSPPSGSQPLTEPDFLAQTLPVLLTNLLQLFSYEKEKVRELSLNFFISLLASPHLANYDFAPSLTTFSSLFTNAFSSAPPAPFAEPAEEIRLLLIKVTIAFLNHSSTPADVTDHTTEKGEDAPKSSLTVLYTGISLTLARALSDPFPEVKREGCLLIAKLFKVAPIALRYNLKALVTPLIANSSHQHSKTRQMTVKALAMVLTAANGPDDCKKVMNDTVLPTLLKVSFDKIPTVRKALITAAARIAKHALTKVTTQGANPTSIYEPFAHHLVSLVLSCCCDETVEVAEMATKELANLADIFASAKDDDARVDAPPSPPTAAANTGAVRAMISHFFPSLLTPLVASASHWTLGQREQSMNTLATLFTLTDPAVMVDYVDVIINMLASAIHDDEESVVSSTTRCAESLARSLGPESGCLFTHLLPRMDGSMSGFNTAEKLAAHMRVMAAFIRTASADVIVGGGDAGIAECLASSGIVDCGDRDVYEALHATLCAFIDATDAAVIAKSAAPILLCVVYLIGADINFDLREEGVELLGRIGALGAKLDDHFATLVDKLRPPSVIEEFNPRLRAFDALLRSSGAATGKHFGEVIGIFEDHLKLDVDAEIRLQLMALLESIMGDASTAAVMKSHMGVLINDIITPNIVWKAGGVASTIRKVSIACLFTVLKMGAAESQVLFMAAPKLLPVLKTNLGDYDASSRQLCVLSLGILFAALPGALGFEPVHQLYPELLKCLDDSSDDVRFAACGTLKVFLLAAPKEHFKGTLMDYMCDQLLIHLDDPDEIIQKAVFEILIVASSVDKGVVEKKTVGARRAHRDVKWCDMVLSQIK